jgi:hypothetical protein
MEKLIKKRKSKNSPNRQKSVRAGNAVKKEEVVFVGVNNPINLRRNVLGSSKEVIDCLKRYESLKIVRKEKLENIMRFKEDAKEVLNLISKLSLILPAVKVEGEKPIVLEKKEVIKEIKKPAPSSEIEKLQYELDDIESKLNALG